MKELPNLCYGGTLNKRQKREGQEFMFRVGLEDILSILYARIHHCPETKNPLRIPDHITPVGEDMLSLGKKNAYLEVEHHIKVRMGTRLPDGTILRSALHFIDEEIRTPRIVAYEGYLREGFEECRIILYEEISKLDEIHRSHVRTN